MHQFTMSDNPITYLLDRFATDATTLRARAQMLAGQPAPPHGPDAAASREMAEACEEVMTLLHDVDAGDDETLLEALEALGPKLHALAERAKSDFVRSVYGGAATRISEIVQRTRGDDEDEDSYDGDGDDDEDPSSDERSRDRDALD